MISTQPAMSSNTRGQWTIKDMVKPIAYIDMWRDITVEKAPNYAVRRKIESSDHTFFSSPSPPGDKNFFLPSIVMIPFTRSFISCDQEGNVTAPSHTCHFSKDLCLHIHNPTAKKAYFGVKVSNILYRKKEDTFQLSNRWWYSLNPIRYWKVFLPV